MKKILVLALAIVMALSVVALVACDNGNTYTGECHYDRTSNGNTTTYGAKVDVTVKGDVITAVKLYEDKDTGWVRTTSIWGKGEGQMQYDDTDLGHDAAEAAYADWINKVFVGKTVAEVNAYVASATADGQTVGTASANLAGATQSAARIICAVKDALSKIDAAK